MKNGKNFSVLLNYLTSRWLGFALVGVFAGCLAVVLVLYRLPAEPVAYALLLAVSISSLVLAVDYGKYRQRYNVLLRLQTQVNLGMENLPRPTDLVEREYQRLLNLVWSEHQSSLAEREKIQSDLVEYYTLWAHQVKVPIAAMRLLLQTEDAEVSVLSWKRNCLESNAMRIWYCSICGWKALPQTSCSGTAAWIALCARRCVSTPRYLSVEA